MRDQKRIDEVLAALKAYWEKNPDLRLGQIVGNASLITRGEPDPFYMEEDTFLRGLAQLQNSEGSRKHDDNSDSSNGERSGS